MSYTPIATQQRNVNGGAGETAISADKTSRIVSQAKAKRASSPDASDKTPIPLNGAEQNFPIIVHCHLCWDWVWQRPQQFLSRLSERHPILFVEMLAPDAQLIAPHARFDT